MKKIIFVTGTRADYGKIKSLIVELKKRKKFKIFIFVTGIHNLKVFGKTRDQLVFDKLGSLHFFNNQSHEIKNNSMDLILAKTINGLNKFINKIKPDLLVVHGDRVESLAGAIVGSLNNIRVAHVEGGEVSGTIDEALRHSISKLAHVHFVTNNKAKKRLEQLGERSKNIYVIGSPDVDIILGKNLPSINDTKKRYNIIFKKYAILILHPVTTAVEKIKNELKVLYEVLVETKFNYIVLYPNNDSGSELIFDFIKKKLSKLKNFRILPSMRFENYLTLLKNSYFIIGNSSSGIMEAPYYGVATLNLGTRQFNRANLKSIYNLEYKKHQISKKIEYFSKKKIILKKIFYFGNGNSHLKFCRILDQKNFWLIDKQKVFVEKNK